ncbi:MAG: hypothetical protein K5669_01300 [Lachnospiraceae bacterium]|nr:hypothetical protein [Lachnospiraceae bacterium]
MAAIDKNMYEELKRWCDRKRGCGIPGPQRIMYVNSHDRALTKSTIRKMMYEIDKEDEEGEVYTAVYSAKSFHRNMRDYYTDISELYRRNPGENDPLVDIIEKLPPTCGWITLIVEDIELLSSKEEMQEMMETIFAFASRNSEIILVGDGDYKKVFSGCEYALKEMAEGIAAKEDDGLVMVACYDQDLNPETEVLTYETDDDRLDELNFYWETVYEQLEDRYFDFDGFKNLFRDTFEYIKPRVSLEQVYRKDISLIENIGRIRREKDNDFDGCDQWEFDTAKEFSRGLHEAIINRYGHQNDYSEEKIGIDVVIKEAEEDLGGIYISGSTYHTVMANADNVISEMDQLSDVICKGTYGGDSGRIWDYLLEKQAEENGLEVTEEMKETGVKLGSLMQDIKDLADKTFNKIPGKKVRRYSGNKKGKSEE